MKKTIFILLIMFMFIGVAKAELQEVPNPDVTITLKLNEIQPTSANGDASLCWYQAEEMCSRKAAARITVSITNDMDVPLEIYKIYLPGDNVYVAPYGSNYNWFWHTIKYDEEIGKYYFDENYREDIVQNQWVQTPTEIIPAHSTVTIGGDFWYFTDDENLNTTVQNLFTYEDVEPTPTDPNNGDNTNNDPAPDLDNTHNVENNEQGELLYTIKFDGGKDVKESMEDTPIYDGKKVTLPKNKFKNDKYIFAGWKVYLEDAEGKRTEVKVAGKVLVLKDGDELPEIDVPRGSTLVLAAQWTTNPKTGYLIPIAVVALAIMIGLIYIIKAKKYNKIAEI